MDFPSHLNDPQDTRANLADIGLLILRLGVGVGLFALHGKGKLLAAADFVGGGTDWKFVEAVRSLGFPLPGFFAVAAALAESFASLMVAAGFFTRFHAAMAVSTMVVAMFSHFRAGQPAELAWLYFLTFLSLSLTGPGRYSVDALLLDRWRLRSLGRA